MLDKNTLLEFFYKGIKSVDNLKIGTEHEKFILNKDTLAPLNYYEKNGILDVFKSLMEYGWLPVTEGEKETIIGLRLNNQSISLEPSGQIELSGKPLNNIHETCDEITNHLNQMKKISTKHNFILLGMGVEPSLALKNFTLMPKDRYNIMNNYMSITGTKGLDMMKRTCSTQINFDFHSEEDMIKKFRVLMSLESIGTAIFANSPFEYRKLSSYKSLRSYFWQKTDNERTGILPFIFNEDFNFEKYVEYALKVPMYFVKRNNKYIDVTGSNFKDFIKGDLKKLKGVKATYEDWSDHLTTLFPQVRLKQVLEIRSMDACSWKEICSQPAFWTGIIYDQDSLDEAWDICNKWTNDDRLYLYNNVPKYGLQTKFKKNNVLEIAKIFFDLSLRGLRNRNFKSKKYEYNETKYLDVLSRNLAKGQSPADISIDDLKKENNKNFNIIYKENIF